MTTVCFILLLAVVLVAGQQELGHIENLLQAQEDGVSVLWGLPDTTAVIGKAFHFQVPQDAFSGSIQQFLIKEVGKESLPSWLHYDADSQLLSGVPFHGDADHQVYLQVTAKGPNVEATDIFAINIANDERHSDAVPLKDISNSLNVIRCPQGSSVTKATIVVDADAANLSGKDRFQMIDAMRQHLNMPSKMLRMQPLDNLRFFDSSALVAGPGDVTEPKNTPVALEWEVGCGNVQAVHMPILTQAEASSSDGTMRNAVGHGIVGWYVTNHKAQTPKRLKRQVHQVHLTQTAEISYGLPTDRPVATYTVTDTQPTSRSVPTMASPSFTDIEATTTHKHKHHRSKTAGRHHHKTKHPKHSPTPLQTQIPTASTDMPIMATPVASLAPSSMEPSLTPVMPIMEPSTPIMSPSAIQPSVTPHQSSSSTPTEGLPSVPSSTQPIRPTSEDIIATQPTEMPSTDADNLRSTTSPPVPTPIEEFNFPPMVKQYLRPQKIMEGDILDFQIPENTFKDYEDGNSRNLKLLLLTIDGLSVPPISWIQLNQTSQSLYGLPREMDIGKHEYLLAAVDKEGKLARLVFDMTVERRPRFGSTSHELSVTMDLNYKAFVLDVRRQIEVAQKLASLYGDPNTDMISVIRLEEGSVKYVWTNNSLDTNKCPIRAISDLLAHLLTPEKDINPKLIKAMDPVEVTKVEIESKGICKDYSFMTDVDGDNDKHTKNDDGEEEASGAGIGEVEGDPRETSDEDILITTVIPAVVIAAMLLLAGLIACILYRKKRKGKLSDEDQHTFINKGIPIIFSDELEERPDQPTKPLILADEKPPLPPPDYQRSASGSVLSTPRSDHKEPLIQDPLSTDDEMSPYHPPPPVTGSLGRSRPSNNQPAYRSPPPYVPP